MPGARVATGDDVTLRTVETEDVPFLQRAGANPELRYMLGSPVRCREEFEVPAEDADGSWSVWTTRPARARRPPTRCGPSGR